MKRVRGAWVAALAWVALGAPVAAAAAGIAARCVAVPGCGSIVTSWRGQRVRVQVEGVVAAVKDAERCRSALSELVLDEVVWVDFSTGPSRGEASGVVRLGWTKVADELVRRGVAQRPAARSEAVVTPAAATALPAPRSTPPPMTREELRRSIRQYEERQRRAVELAAQVLARQANAVNRPLWRKPLVSSARPTVRVEVAAPAGRGCTRVCVEVCGCAGERRFQAADVDPRLEWALRQLSPPRRQPGSWRRGSGWAAPPDDPLAHLNHSAWHHGIRE